MIEIIKSLHTGVRPFHSACISNIRTWVISGEVALYALPLIVLLLFLCSCSSPKSDGSRGGLVNAGLPTLVPTAAAVIEPTSTNTAEPQPTVAPTEVPITETPQPTNTPVPPTSSPEPPTDTRPPDIPSGDPASVINIVDGDTIDVQIDGVQYAVRYIGMTLLSEENL